jgi:hypothetical protein
MKKIIQLLIVSAMTLIGTYSSWAGDDKEEQEKTTKGSLADNDAATKNYSVAMTTISEAFHGALTNPQLPPEKIAEGIRAYGEFLEKVFSKKSNS